MAAIAADCPWIHGVSARSGGGPELWSPPSVHRWPRRRWRAPGPGTEEQALDASPIVAPWPSRDAGSAWARSSVALTEGAAHARDDLPRAAGRDDQPPHRDRRRLAVRRTLRVRDRQAHRARARRGPATA